MGEKSDTWQRVIKLGTVGIVVQTDNWPRGAGFDVDFPGYSAYEMHDDELSLIKGDKPMGRRTFRLIKDTPDIKKGALLQEACDDGDQGFRLLDPNNAKYVGENNHDYDDEIFPRNCVTQQPKWFEEVFPATEAYITKEELEAFKKFTKAQKAKKPRR